MTVGRGSDGAAGYSEGDKHRRYNDADPHCEEGRDDYLVAVVNGT